MPISSSNPDDAIIWRFDSLGCYSVKSGYKMLAHVSDSQIVVSTNSNVAQVKRLYSALWSLAIPMKIKVKQKRCIIFYFALSLTTSYLTWALIFSYPLRSITGELTSIADNDTSLCPALRMHWIPPLSDAIKVNFDACFSSRYRTSFSGVVARNNGGYIMAVGTIPHHFVPSPEVAEAYACIDALMLARDAGFNSVIIEGDALTVINKANCREADRSVLRSLVKQIHSMRAFFISLTFSHVVRTCNAVAHLLAREGRDFPGLRFWAEEAPPSVEESALKDKRWVDLQN
ncbi:hypothetical protein V6N12_020386 [Hibiscus sabdariffa]|uniref:RNase H type-1 domain-containing protein n=1 Tax=Hibiscus sabdariffa TaxID=183260 RepID=A0ABR2D0K6_9ROSI